MPKQQKQENVNALLIIVAFIVAAALAAAASMLKEKIGADAARHTRQAQQDATSL